MHRRQFIKNSTLASGGIAPAGSSIFADAAARLAFVETDPGSYDPDFRLSYFKRIHADGALLSAGGIVAFYPTDIPLHHRSDKLGNPNPLKYMVDGCRKMNMSICLRTDRFDISKQLLTFDIPLIADHEIVALDFQ